MAKTPPTLYACRFEVFGKVQHVCFRNHAEAEAQRLNLRGYIMYSSHGSVFGVLEGPRQELDQMKAWLEFKGSPVSRIDSARFSELLAIKEFSYRNFAVQYA